jgi:predicted acyl esterase
MKARLISHVSFLVVFVLTIATASFSQGLEYIKGRYTKHEYTIPMRDGIRLFTAIYIPKDRSTTYPILLKRTPYNVGPYGSDRAYERGRTVKVVGAFYSVLTVLGRFAPRIALRRGMGRVFRPIAAKVE